MLTGDLTWRRFGVLARNLPRESATAQSVHGPTAAWGDTEHLMATAVDLLAAANWQRSGGKGPRPQRVRRPGAGPRRTGTPHTRQAMRRILDTWSKRKG